MKWKFLGVPVICLITGASAPVHPVENPKAGLEVIFDGKSTDKLRAYQKPDFPKDYWTVVDGALKTVPSKNNVDLVTKDQYKNFELQLEWKTSVGGNSGVFYHVQEDQHMEGGNGNSPNWLNNFEMQLLDDIGFADKDPKRSFGSLYDLIEPKNKVVKPVGEYNTVKLIVNGNDVQHWINGKKVVEYTLKSPELNALVKGSKYKDIVGFAKYDEGHIQFQHHGQEVWFKDIKIRRL